MRKFLDHNKILSKAQHGFRNNLSTNTAGFEFTQAIYESIDSNNFTIALYFDLTRPFDCVDTTFLTQKLNALGFRGNFNLLVKSFMTGRKIRVRFGSIMSECFEQEFGVPQGGVLSPLLFILFINDIVQFLEGFFTPDNKYEIVVYADDSTIIISCSSLQRAILNANLILQKFYDWSSKNKLIVNESKTQYMVFYKRRLIPEFALTMNNVAINKVDSCKFLGLYVDSQLSWIPHIDYIAGKLNTAYFAIVNLKSIMSKKQLLNVYFALAYSHIKYMILFWGQSTETNRIFILQKRILRKIFSLSPLESCRELFRNNNLLTVYSILILESAMFVKKYQHKFPAVSTVHNYQTRQISNIVIQNYNLSTFKKSPKCFCSYVYNKIPVSIREIVPIRKFKRTLQDY